MLADNCTIAKKTFTKALKLMGNRFEITAVAQNEVLANIAIQAAITEIQRIEKLLTTFSDESETSLINNNAGIAPVKISSETFCLIQRSLKNFPHNPGSL